MVDTIRLYSSFTKKSRITLSKSGDSWSKSTRIERTVLVKNPLKTRFLPVKERILQKTCYKFKNSSRLKDIVYISYFLLEFIKYT